MGMGMTAMGKEFGVRSFFEARWKYSSYITEKVAWLNILKTTEMYTLDEFFLIKDV